MKHRANLLRVAATLVLALTLAACSSGGSPAVTPADGTSGGGAAPSAPTNLLMTLQGLTAPDPAGNCPPPNPQYPAPYNSPYINTSLTQIGWTQGVPGNYPIAYNKIYRSTTSATTGFSLLHQSNSPITSYTDTTATNSIFYGDDTGNGPAHGTPYFPATTYWYRVSAVDNQGNESQLSPTQRFWAYYNGASGWRGAAGDLSSAGTANYTDTTGLPEEGPYDIAFTLTSAWGLFQPTSGNTVPFWNMWAGAFDTFIFDFKPWTNGQPIDVVHEIAGDINMTNSSGSILTTHAAGPTGLYGPVPVVGQWGHYAIPMNIMMQDYGPGGAYAPQQERMIYKFRIQDQTGSASGTFYLDNIGYVSVAGANTMPHP